MGKRFKGKRYEEKPKKQKRPEKVEKQKVQKEPKKQKRKSGKKKIWFFIVIIIILTGITVFFWDNKEIVENIITNVEENKVTEEDNSSEIVDIDIPDTMGDYSVIGKLVIDKLGVEKNILDKTTDSSLKLSVTKFYGPNANEVGNFCISGHNYKDTFAYLGRLENGDTFYVVDKLNYEKVTYKVYDKFTVNPTELDCIDQETEGKREVTLITCNPGGLTRLIIKASEI